VNETARRHPRGIRPRDRSNRSVSTPRRPQLRTSAPKDLVDRPRREHTLGPGSELPEGSGEQRHNVGH
jgi:hypothetical protein